MFSFCFLFLSTRPVCPTRSHPWLSEEGKTPNCGLTSGGKRESGTAPEVETGTLPFDDPRHVLPFQAFDGGVNLQMFLQSDPRPQRVHLWTVAHVLQRSAVVSHHHLDKDESNTECFPGSAKLLNRNQLRRQRKASVLSLLYLASSGVSVTWQHVHNGGLSCSVGAQQAKNFTWGNSRLGWSRSFGGKSSCLKKEKDRTHLCGHRRRRSLWPASSSCLEKTLLSCPCSASSGYSQPPPASKQTERWQN